MQIILHPHLTVERHRVLDKKRKTFLQKNLTDDDRLDKLSKITKQSVDQEE